MKLSSAFLFYANFIYRLIQIMVLNELTFLTFLHSYQLTWLNETNVFTMNDTGNQDVRIVHHQNLNKRILLALIACSALLAGIFIFLLFFFFRRHKKLTISASKSRGTIGIMVSILSDETFILILLF